MNKKVKFSGLWTAILSVVSVAYIFPILLVLINSFNVLPLFFRVISTSPRGVISTTLVWILSNRAYSLRTDNNLSLLSCCAILIKSIIIIPEIFLKRSCLIISIPASILVFKMLFSLSASFFAFVTFLPELTSTTLIASVCSIIM